MFELKCLIAHFLPRIRRGLKCLGYLGLWIPMVASANVSGDLGSFFSSLGFAGNVSSGSAYHGQAAGYYSGGSAFLRDQVRNIQIMHIDAPSFRSGCGGIDLFAGGFSFVNARALTDFFRRIISNAEGYGLNLALETEVPEIAHSMQYIQQIAQKINNSNMNSCEMSEDMVGGLWPKTRASQQQVCQDIGTQDNAFSDWAKARQACTTGDDFNDQLNKAASDPRYQDRVLLNKNLIWSVIRKNDFLSSDTELSELFMSLSGTITYDNAGKATIFYPITNNRSLIKALLEGGSTQLYQCDEVDRCLKPTLQTISIKSEDGLKKQVMAMINQLVIAVQNDKPLSDQQKGFLNSVNIPILRFITISLSLKGGGQPLDVSYYADIISKSLLQQYLLEALNIVSQSIAAGDYTPELQARLRMRLQDSLTQVEDLKTAEHTEIQDTLSMIQSMREHEREITANISANMRNGLDRGEK